MIHVHTTVTGAKVPIVVATQPAYACPNCGAQLRRNGSCPGCPTWARGPGLRPYSPR